MWGGDGGDGGFSAQRRRQLGGGPGGPAATSGPARSGVSAASAGGGSGTLQIGPAIVSGTLVSFSVSCAGVAGATCSAGLALSVNETLRGRKIIAVAPSANTASRTRKKQKKPKTTMKTIVLGTATVTLQALQSETVRIALDGAGKRLLHQHHNLKVRLAVTANGKTVTVSTITFKLKAATHKKTHHQH